MGRKKSARPFHSIRIYDEAYRAVRLLCGYTGEDFNACLSRLAEEGANREIPALQAEWAAKQANKADPG